MPNNSTMLSRTVFGALMFFAWPTHLLAASNGSGGYPDAINRLLASGDTVLAYKTLDKPGPGGASAAVVVRHRIPADPVGFDQNPCDLLILKKEKGEFEVIVKSNQIVDCTYIIGAREIAKYPTDLNKYLIFNSHEIGYDNEKAVGRNTYVFKFSLTRHKWYLDSAISIYTEPNYKYDRVDVIEEKLKYPTNVGFISFSDFNVSNVADMQSHYSRILP